MHAQLQFIAQLNGTSITDEIRQSIATRIRAVQDDPELLGRAAAVQEQLERQAESRRAAIASFLGEPAVKKSIGPDKPANPTKRS